MSLTDYGIKVGSKLKVAFMKSGATNNKPWQLFSHDASVKDKETKKYKKIGNYTIFINNPQPLQNGDIVAVTSITSVSVSVNTVNGRTYSNIVVNCSVEKKADKDQIEALKDIDKALNNDADFNFDDIDTSDIF